MPLEIKTAASSEEAQQVAISALKDVLLELDEAQTNVLLLLSGGGNIQIAEQVSELINKPHVTCYVLDERFSAEPGTNNSLQLQAKGIHVRATVPETGESLADFGQRFSTALQTWLENNPSGKVVATLGMGADGHIAGISPFPAEAEKFDQLFMNTQVCAVAYRGNLQPPERVTVTPHFLLTEVDHLIGFVSGEAKAPAWQRFLTNNSQPHQEPAQLLHQVAGRVLISTDIQSGEKKC